MTGGIYRVIFYLWALAGLAALPARAEVRIWDDGDAGNSYWSDPDNWDPNGYAQTDDLIVTSGAATANANVSIAGGGSITLDGPTPTID